VLARGAGRPQLFMDRGHCGAYTLSLNSLMRLLVAALGRRREFPYDEFLRKVTDHALYGTNGKVIEDETHAAVRLRIVCIRESA